MSSEACRWLGAGWCLHGGFGARLPVNAVRSDCDLNRAIGFLVEVWPFRLVLVVGLVCIDDGHIAGAEHFEPIVKVSPGSEGLCAEARTGIIDFKQRYCLAGVVADRCLNVRRMTSDKGKQTGEKGNGTERTHDARVTVHGKPRHFILLCHQAELIGCSQNQRILEQGPGFQECMLSVSSLPLLFS